jgi:hypothetical protein
VVAALRHTHHLICAKTLCREHISHHTTLRIPPPRRHHHDYLMFDLDDPC